MRYDTIAISEGVVCNFKRYVCNSKRYVYNFKGVVCNFKGYAKMR